MNKLFREVVTISTAGEPAHSEIFNYNIISWPSNKLQTYRMYEKHTSWVRNWDKKYVKTATKLERPE